MCYESMVNNIRDMRSGGTGVLHHQRGMGAGGAHDGDNVGGRVV